MIGVRFGEKHSAEDFGLILTDVSIGIPQAKTEKVSIPGRSGDLDLTDTLYDEPVYENRTLSFTFQFPGSPVLWPRILSKTGGFLHGQDLEVIIENDPDYYYYGRCTINSFETDRRTGTIVIEVDAEPYKYACSETVYTITQSGTVTLINDRMKAIPVVTVTDETTITVDGTSVSCSAGTYTMTGMPLAEGANEWEIETSGTVTITYRQGRL